MAGNVGYGGTFGSCKNGADAMGVTTIDGVAVGKAVDVEDSGGVVPKTEENTRSGGADNEAREFAIPPTLSDGFSPGGADGITTDGVVRAPSRVGKFYIWWGGLVDDALSLVSCSNSGTRCFLRANC